MVLRFNISHLSLKKFYYKNSHITQDLIIDQMTNLLLYREIVFLLKSLLWYYISIPSWIGNFNLNHFAEFFQKVLSIFHKTFPLKWAVVVLFTMTIIKKIVKNPKLLNWIWFFFRLKRKRKYWNIYIVKTLKSLIETQATTHMNTQQYGSEMQS